MSSHWDKCRVIASFLDVSYMQIHNSWKALKELGLIEPLLNGVETERVKAKDLVVSINKKKGDYQPKLYTDDVNASGIAGGNNNLVDLATHDLKLAFWFINKIGDIDRAEQIMNSALSATRTYINAQKVSSVTSGHSQANDLVRQEPGTYQRKA